MKPQLTYLIQGFGFKNIPDFIESTFTVAVNPVFKKTVITTSMILATLMTWIEQVTGLHFFVILAFIYLICAEFQTGLKVAVLRKGEKFKSRKFGRMIAKIGVYVMIILTLNQLSSHLDAPVMFGLSINPFVWLYYTVFIMIVFQLVISYLENLSALGYKEMKGILGFLLRKYNKWFEFDGTKDGDSFQ